MGSQQDLGGRHQAASLPSQLWALWSQEDLEAGLGCGDRGRWELQGHLRAGSDCHSQGSLSQCGRAALQLLTLESNDDSQGSVLHNLEEILADLKGLIVPCRAGTRSGSAAAASPAGHAWAGCSHPPLPQFPCLERRLKGTFPSLAGTGKHEMCVPRVGQGPSRMRIPSCPPSLVLG